MKSEPLDWVAQRLFVKLKCELPAREVDRALSPFPSLCFRGGIMASKPVVATARAVPKERPQPGGELRPPYWHLCRGCPAQAAERLRARVVPSRLSGTVPLTLPERHLRIIRLPFARPEIDAPDGVFRRARRPRLGGANR